MRRFVTAAFLLLVSVYAGAQDSTFTVRFMTLETATRAAHAALESCRTSGFQVAVAVVDRSGLTQVLLRDRFAGAHTVDMAVDKAWTAASFRTNTSVLAEASEPGKAMSGLRARPRFVAVGGGIVIEGGGALLGAIGVSGAPGGDRDDVCARAGIEAVRQNLDF